MDRRQLTNYVNFAALISYILDGHPHLDRPWYHDTFKHLDHHPLEAKRQDVKLHLRRFLSARRTVSLRIIANENKRTP